MKLTDCMQKQAIELLNFRIMIDPEFHIIDRRLRHEWQTKLTVLQVAKLMIKFFSPNGLGECTLAESFSQVPFHYQIASHDHENATFARYNCGRERCRKGSRVGRLSYRVSRLEAS